jgi:hypothetical protein
LIARQGERAIRPAGVDRVGHDLAEHLVALLHRGRGETLGGEVGHPLADAQLADGGELAAAEAGQDEPLQQQPIPGLGRAAKVHLSRLPTGGPLGQWRLAQRRIGVGTAGLVDLDLSSKPLGVDLALEGLAAQPPVRVVPPDFPGQAAVPNTFSSCGHRGYPRGKSGDLWGSSTQRRPGTCRAGRPSQALAGNAAGLCMPGRVGRGRYVAYARGGRGAAQGVDTDARILAPPGPRAGVRARRQAGPVPPR